MSAERTFFTRGRHVSAPGPGMLRNEAARAKWCAITPPGLLRNQAAQYRRSYWWPDLVRWMRARYPDLGVLRGELKAAMRRRRLMRPDQRRPLSLAYIAARRLAWIGSK